MIQFYPIRFVQDILGPRIIEARAKITGRVQGVRFRPLIYRKAMKHGVRGYVKNLGDAGVELVVEGSKEKIENFIEEIKTDAPQVSEIKDVSVKYGSYKTRFNSFIIDKSEKAGRVTSGIFPPDIGICPDCVRDMESPGGRWYRYHFTTCAWCGLRFTAVNSIPYDKERTHMASFTLYNL